MSKFDASTFYLGYSDINNCIDGKPLATHINFSNGRLLPWRQFAAI